LLDEDDIPETAAKLNKARFKQKHVEHLSREDLIAAQITPAVIKDLKGKGFFVLFCWNV